MICSENKVENLFKKIIIQIGENTNRKGLKKTPIRAARAIRFLTQGYQIKLQDILNDAIFSAETNSMILVKNIEFYSLCEHHLLPISGRCHIAYIPKKKIIGLSKIPRIVDMFCRRLQMQENLTKEIACCLESVIKPQGVAVVIEGKHFCMSMRGVKKQFSVMTTSLMLGLFQNNYHIREEFLHLIK